MDLPIDPEHESMNGHEHKPFEIGFGIVIGPEGIEEVGMFVGCETCEKLQLVERIEQVRRMAGFNVTSRSQPMGMEQQAQEIANLPTVDR